MEKKLLFELMNLIGNVAHEQAMREYSGPSWLENFNKKFKELEELINKTFPNEQ